MRRSAVILTLFLSAWLGQSSSALAASDVQLEHAADGTLVVVGSGWHHGQRLVVDVGHQQFTVRPDASGDFELATGLPSSTGELAVHHPAATSDLAISAIRSATPNPLAVLFAWSLAEGMTFLGGLAGLGLVVAGVLRRLRVSRYPRD